MRHHLSLAVWLVVIAAGWTTLLTAQLAWNIATDRRVADELFLAASPSGDPNEATLRPRAVLKPMERTEFALQAATWSLGMLVLGAVWLSGRARQRERTAAEAERAEASRERAHREAELRESQFLARIGSWEWTIATGAISWSDGLNHLLARPPGTAAPAFEALEPFYAPDSWQRLGAAINATVATGVPYDLELQMIRADGVTCWTATRGEAIRAAEGTVVGLRGVVHDITARKRAEDAVREGEAQYRQAVNATNDGMWDINLVDGTARFNEPYAATFGRPSAEDGDPWAWWVDHVHPEDRDRTVTSFYAAVNGAAAVWKCEYRFRRLDGTWTDTYDRAHIARDSTGKAQYIVGALADMTERKSAAKAIAQANQDWADTFDAVTDMITVHDDSFNVIRGNAAAHAVFGPVIRECEPFAKCFMCYHGADEPPHGCPGRRCLETGEPTTAEVFEPHLGRHLEIRAMPRVGSEGRVVGVIHVVRDITARKEADEERSRLEGQLQQAQKMESVGRLAGGVAHDFNNMLGVILGHSELALDGMDAGHPIHRHLTQIEKAAGHSAKLTNQLLAFARRQTVARQVLDLNDTVSTMLKMLQRLIGEDIALAWIPGARLWPVWIDPTQIDQALANLCVNARDAIAGGGEIIIETRNATLDAAACHGVPEAVPGDYVVLAVSDTGVGMSPEVIARIFEPFFTTKEPGRGTGLGLATVYGIARQNGGFITVHSEIGLGTTFTLHLPRHEGARPPASVEPAARPAGGARETILVVEDEAAILRVTQRMLEKLGYVVPVSYTHLTLPTILRV